MKNFVINSEITGNTISDCGVHAFVFGSDPENKNGEGIYIGTSLNQVSGAYRKTKPHQPAIIPTHATVGGCIYHFLRPLT